MEHSGTTTPQLPQEIWDIILDFKEKLEIEIPGRYIICKTIDGKYKEQVAHIDARHLGKSKYVYEYNYGLFGYHEGYCTRDQIRFLTLEEQDLVKNNQFFNLPQQFYHSIPNFD